MQEKNEIFYKFLPNGAKIVLEKSDSPVTYVGIMIGSGTRHEAEDENGLAHYIEHTVFKGTAHHTARQLITRIEGVGGEINAYTTKEETCFYAATPSEHWRGTFRLIGEMVTCPTFPKDETDKEMEVIMDEIESYNDSPSELIYDEFESLIFPATPLGRPILGTKKSLHHIAKHPAIAQRWIADQYRPERMVFFVSGHANIESVEHEVWKILENLDRDIDINIVNQEHTLLGGSRSSRSDGRTLRGIVGVMSRDRKGIEKEKKGSIQTEKKKTIQTNFQTDISAIPKETVYRRHTHQAHVMLGGYAHPLGHERQLAVYLINNILGGGALNSRLNLSLREQRGLVYNVDSQYSPLSDTGYWSVYLACDAKDKDRCVELVKKELDRLCLSPLTASQLERQLRQLHGQMAISAENRENHVLAMAKHVLYFNDAPSWEETFLRIASFTPEQLLETAQTIFNPEKVVTLCYL